MKSYLRKVSYWFTSLNTRERWLVITTTTLIGLYLVTIPIQFVSESLAGTEQELRVLTGQLRELSTQLVRYKALKAKLEGVEGKFNRAALSYEQVTEIVDKAVKGSSSSATYDLKKARDIVPFGSDFDKQDYTLIVSGLNLEQIINLLFELSQKSVPLFVGKVDLTSSGANATDFTVTLDLSSIGKGDSRPLPHEKDL